jgi:glycosyltransferase involved in cell wall biosynthesis
MRILMISDVYFPRVNGVSTSIRTFRRELIALGHEVTLVVPAYASAEGDDDDIIRVPSRKVPRDPEDRMMRRNFLDRLFPELLRRRCEIAHIQTPFVAHYAGVELAQRLRIPVVESYHTFFEEYLHHYVPIVPRGLMKLLARRFTVSQCKAVDRLISPSSAMKTALCDYGVRTKIEILPTGLDQAQFREGNGARFRLKHNIPSTAPTLLYVGRVAHEKNIGFLLQVFREVLSRIPNAIFVIAGEGPALPSLRAQAVELGIVERLKFIGYLDRDTELLDCYRAGDLFIFASRTETQGLVLLEALAQGTPVVSTAHMGTCDVLEHARGARIASDDIASFAQAVCDLLLNDTARERLGLLAPIDASKWSSRAFAERLARCYEGAIESRQNTTVDLQRASA